MLQVIFWRVEIRVQSQRCHLLKEMQALLVRPNLAVESLYDASDKIGLEHRAGPTLNQELPSRRPLPCESPQPEGGFVVRRRATHCAESKRRRHKLVRTPDRKRSGNLLP